VVCTGGAVVSGAGICVGVSVGGTGGTVDAITVVDAGGLVVSGAGDTQSKTFIGAAQPTKPAGADGHGKVGPPSTPGQHWAPAHITPLPGHRTCAPTSHLPSTSKVPRVRRTKDFCNNTASSASRSKPQDSPSHSLVGAAEPDAQTASEM